MKKLAAILLLIQIITVTSFADSRSYVMSQGTVDLDRLENVILNQIQEYCSLMNGASCNVNSIEVLRMRGSYAPDDNVFGPISGNHVHVVIFKLNGNHNVSCSLNFHSQTQKVNFQNDCNSSTLRVADLNSALTSFDYKDVGLPQKADY